MAPTRTTAGTPPVNPRAAGKPSRFCRVLTPARAPTKWHFDKLDARLEKVPAEVAQRLQDLTPQIAKQIARQTAKQPAELTANTPKP